MPQNLKLHIPFTKSRMLEEHYCLILTSYHSSKLRYRAHAGKYEPLPHNSKIKKITKSLKRDDIEMFCL